MTTSTAPDETDGLLLPGLDGTNPLGFLAAIGVLIALDQVDQLVTPKLAWRPYQGTWVASVRLAEERTVDGECVIQRLLDVLNGNTAEHPARRWEVFCEGTATQIHQLLDTEPDAWSACIGIEPLPHTRNDKRLSQLQTARKDYHVKAINNLLVNTNDEHLRRTLFKHWDYADPLEGLTLHIDPSEDRRHANQWNQPAGDPDRKTHGNMIAANRLALEAYPLFPIVHINGMSQTMGFKGHYMHDTYWTWPLWSSYIDAHVISSVLSLAELQRPLIQTSNLRHLGIEAVMRSQRILVGKTPNFTPAQRIG